MGNAFLFILTRAKNLSRKQKSFLLVKKKEQKIENISKETLLKFQKHYRDEKISKWCVFYFVYGLLHSPEYKNRFASDLKKVLPRLPFLKEKIKNFWNFSRVFLEIFSIFCSFFFTSRKLFCFLLRFFALVSIKRKALPIEKKL